MAAAAGIIRAREAGFTDEEIRSGRTLSTRKGNRQISRRGCWIRAIINLAIGVVFGVGAVYDHATGLVSPTWSLLVAAALGLLALRQAVKALTTSSVAPSRDQNKP